MASPDGTECAWHLPDRRVSSGIGRNTSFISLSLLELCFIVRVLSWWRFVPRYMIIIIIIIINVFVRGLCCAEFVLAEGLFLNIIIFYYLYYYYY